MTALKIAKDCFFLNEIIFRVALSPKSINKICTGANKNLNSSMLIHIHISYQFRNLV